MFRAAPRLIARSALPRTVAPARRYISTAPPTQKSRSWKSLVARFGIAGTIIYYYNTTDVFAEEPRQEHAYAIPETESESEDLPTIEAIAAERQRRKQVQAQLDAQKEAQSAQHNAPPAGGEEGGMGGLEEEADQQGAFNPETGEINWDCPCLGGMADGPCGPEFKAAFSCFVFSEEEPKGMDCIDRFKDMQNCFRKYPEVYGSELEGADDDDEAELSGDSPTPALADTNSSPSSQSTETPRSSTSTKAPARETSASDKGKLLSDPSLPTSPEKGETESRGLGLVPQHYKPDTKKTEEPVSESENLVPKAAFDAGDENTKVLERK
ncbi:hypothetical protein BKA63DRAFT_516567 [Paraphoma chrysanthemicola]|nr:hypothetical protein BKA63DRAFT_516567 [Paraphoma chrysanthemicola]